MGESEQALRQNIEHTRHDLGHTLDAIEDRVRPSRAMSRRTNRMADGVQSLRHRVMGTAHDAADQVGSVPDIARRQAEGAPLLAGAVAFGMGFLAARVLPTTEAERAQGEAIAERVEPFKHEMAQAGREAGQHVAASAKESAAAVQDAATTAAGQVADEARQAGGSSAR